MRPSPRLRPSRLRVTPLGLRWRLTGWVAVVMVAAAGVTFVAIYRGTGSQLRRQIDQQLSSSATAFQRRMQSSGSADGAAVAANGQAYVRSQPFAATSRLLFIVTPGQGTATNVPELVGLLSTDDGESNAEQRAENRLARALLTARLGFSTVDGPDGGRLRVRVLPVTVAGRVVARVGAGQSLSSVHVAQGGVARTFVLAGAIALLVALLASYLVGERISRPLRRMARVAARVDGGDLSPRIHASGSRGDEVRVLADAFDRMLDRLQDAFARQRSFVADASHELRTPLTVVRGQLELLARERQPSVEEVRRVEHLVQAEVSRMSRMVDELLLLAHSDEPQFLRAEAIDLVPFLEELWMGVEHLSERRFALQVAADGDLRADPDRLAQALRNLVRNAIEHTAAPAGHVRLSVSPAGAGRVTFAVEDDGPGIPADQRDRVFDRFHRTDVARNRSAGGTGLGLAIVRAIAEAHGGRVEAGHSDLLGGARVQLTLPGFTPLAAARGYRGAVDGPLATPAAGRAPAPGDQLAGRGR
jgi:two-component system OmpR family sensor kinase